MNNYKITAALFLLCILSSCDEYDLVRTNPQDPKSKNFKPSVPELTTTAATSITGVSAKMGGNVTYDGGASVTARGACWNIATGSTTDNSKTADGTGTGSFISSLTGLTASTKYYARAYATNNLGTAYGNELTFTTSTVSPTATTAAATSVTNTTATLNGTVNANNLSTTVTFEYGLTTSYSSTATATQSPVGGTTITNVSVEITGLTSGLTYHYRVKAVSAGGTVYGWDISTTTSIPVNDNDGNVYNTVIVGTQVWMKENLETTKYNDGTSIPLVTDGTAWANSSTLGYCFYNNDAATYKAAYGALYNWFTVNTGKLCPTGWHVPTDAEWTTLTTYLGGESVAGGKLKETGTTHWTSPNTGADNSSGFTALPGGFRDFNAVFGYVGRSGYWWSSTEGSTVNALHRGMQYDGSAEVFGNNDKRYGFSVRCLKD